MAMFARKNAIVRKDLVERIKSANRILENQNLPQDLRKSYEDGRDYDRTLLKDIMIKKVETGQRNPQRYMKQVTTAGLMTPSSKDSEIMVEKGNKL